MFVYLIVCSETLKLYVGQHKGKDLGKYLAKKFWDASHHTSGTRSYLYAAMRKHSRNSWSIHPLISGIESRQELDEIEKHFIRVLKTQHPDVGYNICDGGEGFTGPHTKAARQKMSKKILASYVRRGDAEHQKRSAQSKLRWADPEFRQRVSEIQKWTPNSGRFVAGQTPSPLAGAKEANRTSFAVGHKPWNTGTKGIMKPNSGSFQRKVKE